MIVETSLIPAGAFMMGDDAGRADERPAHEVHVGAFRMALTPVTNAAYAEFLAATGHPPPPFLSDARFRAPDQPAVGVTWHDAMAFCAWLSSLRDEQWRLPTEAEREKAALGGLSRARYPWGDDEGPDGGRFHQVAPCGVGLSGPNGYGLFDMAYNVHEWCSDWYDARYYDASPRENPLGPEHGTRRSARGGAWRHQVKINRCAARSSLDPAFVYNDFGLRLVQGV